jgi:hypothetical protein
VPINSQASFASRHPNTSRRELLVERRELLQVSVEKGETQVGGEEERSLRGSGVHQGAKAECLYFYILERQTERASAINFLLGVCF